MNRIRNCKCLDSHGGSSLILISILSGLTAMMIIFSASSIIVTEEVRRTQVLDRLLEVRTNLLNLIDNDSVWLKTIEDPINLDRGGAKYDCLRGNDADLNCNGAGGNFRLINVDRTVLYDPWTEGAGFDLSNHDPDDPNATAQMQAQSSLGYICTGAITNRDASGNSTFGSTNYDGNQACPIRVTLTWKSTCLVEGCLSPKNTISGKFEINFDSHNSAMLRFNPDNYNFLTSRDSTHP